MRGRYAFSLPFSDSVWPLQSNEAIIFHRHWLLLFLPHTVDCPLLLVHQHINITCLASSLSTYRASPTFTLIKEGIIVLYDCFLQWLIKQNISVTHFVTALTLYLSGDIEKSTVSIFYMFKKIKRHNKNNTNVYYCFISFLQWKWPVWNVHFFSSPTASFLL